MMKTRISTLFLTASLGIAGVAQAEVGVTPTSVRLGTSQSLTGPLAFEGTQQVAGIEAYFDAVNAQGGVNGRKIEWKCYDDAYKPQDAVANLKRLVEQDGIFAVLNTQGTATSKAPIPYLEEKKVPFLFPWQGDSGLAGKKLIFTSYPFYDVQTRLIAHWLVEKKGMKRIGIIYQDDAYGQPFLETLKKELKSMNLELTAAESMKRGASDAAVQVAKMAAANVDACLLALLPGQGAQVLKEGIKNGWKAKLVGAGPLTDESFVALSGGAGEGVWGFTPWPDPMHSPLPAMKKYRETLAKYKPKVTPNRHNLYGYVYAMLAVEGLKKAGKDLTREGLVKGLESVTNWDSGIVPPISFSATDHHAQANGMIVESRGDRFVPVSGWLWIKDGKLTEVAIKE